ncbi:MAG: YfiR family protein [Vicinamibacterales bacterium]
MAAVLLAASSGAVGAQELRTEAQLKAALLFNFARFTVWPDDATAGPLLFTIVDDPAVAECLEELSRGKTLAGRAIQVRRVGGDEAPRPGAVLFVGSAASHAPVLLAQAERGVLTVGEHARFLRDGGMIRLFLEGSRFRFAVDRRNVERAGLKLSAQVLDLAER